MAECPRLLVADIGGTNARFAIVEDDGDPGAPVSLACDDFPDLVDTVGAGLRLLAPRAAAIAVAAPITGDRVVLTNRGEWRFSARAAAGALGLDRLTVVNDLCALALALPVLGRADWTPLGPGPSNGADGAPQAVLGPGTGLGTAAVVPSGEGWVPVAGEGGHVTLAATDDRQAALIRQIRDSGARATPDRLVSGPGLARIHAALAAIDGVDGVPHQAQDIAAGACPYCVETVALFACLLGALAGDLALTYGARGGVYVGGGVVPKLGVAFPGDLFRREFEAKGRFAEYVAAIPTRLITHPHATLIGAGQAFGRIGAGLVHVVS